jgi:AraC-like DNA-binding protein
MLKTIQIIALIQGIFLLMMLFIKRDSYKHLNFWLLFVTIVSLLFHIIGDDDFNLFQTDANWYVFHSPLIVTLLFLLIKYHNNGREKFLVKDLLYFIPYLVFVVLQIFEQDSLVSEHILYVFSEGLVGLIMMGYLGYAIWDIIRHKKENWMLFFLVPYAIVDIVDFTSYYFTGEHDTIPFLESYGIIGLTTLLLYFILFKLVVSPKTVLPKPEITAYKTSSLNRSKIKMYTTMFEKLVKDEGFFKNQNITVTEVANTMGIPRQHLSEILNVYMKTSFQDYVNNCRLDAFVEYVQLPKYHNYTIIGVANEVGFKSKSTFNTTFKKRFNMTPSSYKKSLKYSD